MSQIGHELRGCWQDGGYRYAVVLVAWLLFPAAVPLAASQHVVVVLDDSGSMADAMRNAGHMAKIDAAKQALQTVLGSLPPDAHVGIVVLNQGAGPQSWIVPLGPIERKQTTRAIASVVAHGGTPLGYFMKVAADALLADRKQSRYGTYRLLIVTDGEATDAELVQRYLPDIMARGISVDVIGVDMAQDHSLATSVHSYRRADDPGQLQRAVREVLAESRDASGSSAESDFGLLVGFPDEVADAALVALSHPSGAAIGTTPTSDVSGDETEEVDNHLAGQSETPNAVPASPLLPPPSPTVSSGGMVGALIGLVCFLLVVVVIVVSVVGILKRILS